METELTPSHKNVAENQYAILVKCPSLPKLSGACIVVFLVSHEDSLFTIKNGNRANTILSGGGNTKTMCYTCKQAFPSERQWATHSCHKKLLKCGGCDRKFESSFGMRRHRDGHCKPLGPTSKP
jgi:hypothetical protein